MSITFGQARELLAPYAGVSGLAPEDDGTALFIRKTLQHMLYSNANGDERVFTFHTVNGWITLPYELETPLKVKIDDQVGSVWSKWFDWRHGNLEPGCLDASNAVFIDGNSYCTIYNIPAGGGHVACCGTANEDDDAHIIVCGASRGQEVVTKHEGKEINGEYLCIQKNRLIATQVRFDKINSIYKSKTNGNVPLYSIEKNGANKILLADYGPNETVPQYRRARIQACGSGVVKVSILGRIRIKDHYADSDKLPFEYLLAMETAAQAIQASRGQDMPTTAAKDSLMTNLLGRESSHKQPHSQPMVDVFRPLSNGSIRRPY